jgi:hypothetical protein
VLVLTSLRRHKIRCAISGIIKRETLLKPNSNPRLGGKLFESAIRPLILAGNISKIKFVHSSWRETFLKVQFDPSFWQKPWHTNSSARSPSILYPMHRKYQPMESMFPTMIKSRLMNNIRYPMNTSPVDELTPEDHLLQSH